MKRFHLLPLILAISGCASGPIKTTELAGQNDQQGIDRLIVNQANRCWRKQVDPARKGISVSVTKTRDQGTYVFANLVEWKGPQPVKPFLTVQIKDGPPPQQVTIQEGDFTCGIVNQCVNLNLSEDVANWLAGDLSCKDISKTLLSLGLGF